MTLHISRGDEVVPPGAGQQISAAAQELGIPLLVALVPTEEPCGCDDTTCDGRQPALVVRIAENRINPDLAAAVLTKVVESIRIAAAVGKSKN